MTTDPVCGMAVEPKQAAAHADFQGTTYYFCSHGCHKAFTASPETYAKRAAEKRRPDKPGHKHGGDATL